MLQRSNNVDWGYPNNKIERENNLYKLDQVVTLDVCEVNGNEEQIFQRNYAYKVVHLRYTIYTEKEKKPLYNKLCACDMNLNEGELTSSPAKHSNSYTYIHMYVLKANMPN